MQLLLQHIRIVDPASSHHFSVRDIRITDGIITSIADQLKPEDNETVFNGEGLSVSAGWQDLLAASGDPGQEYREDLHSLADAAVAGGYTGVAVMPATHPAVQSKADIEYILNKTAGQPVRFFPLGAVTRDRQGVELTEIYDMRSAGAVAFTDADLPVSDAGIMLRTLQYVKQFDGIIINVPSDHRIVGNATINEGVMSTRLGMYGIPDVLEEVMVERDILLAEYAGSRVHIAGVSTARALERIRQAKAKGIRVTASVTPYHLYFDEEMLGDYDTNFKVNPPLRTAHDVAALKAAVADGTIDAVASFHLPWDTDAKACEFEYAGFGMATIETCFGAVSAALQGYAPVDRVIGLFTSGPREILGLLPVSVTEGQAANLTIFKEDEAWSIDQFLSKGINQAFSGQPLLGRPVATVLENQFVSLIKV